jgi:hypothetical protein
MLIVLRLQSEKNVLSSLELWILLSSCYNFTTKYVILTFSDPELGWLRGKRSLVYHSDVGKS